jgi:hypothetical protein
MPKSTLNMTRSNKKDEPERIFLLVLVSLFPDLALTAAQLDIVAASLVSMPLPMWRKAYCSGCSC